jgi:hypothetical protein
MKAMPESTHTPDDYYQPIALRVPHEAPLSEPEPWSRLFRSPTGRNARRFETLALLQQTSRSPAPGRFCFAPDVCGIERTVETGTNDSYSIISLARAGRAYFIDCFDPFAAQPLEQFFSQQSRLFCYHRYCGAVSGRTTPVLRASVGEL